MLFHDAFTDLIMVTSAFRFANMELYLSSYLCYLVMYCHMLCMLCFFALCSTFVSLLFPFFAFVAVVFQQYLSVSSTCSLVVCDMIVFVFGDLVHSQQYVFQFSNDHDACYKFIFDVLHCSQSF